MEYVCLIHTHSYMYIMNVVSKIYQRRTLGCNNSSWSSPLSAFSAGDEDASFSRQTFPRDPKPCFWSDLCWMHMDSQMEDVNAFGVAERRFAWVETRSESSPKRFVHKVKASPCACEASKPWSQGFWPTILKAWTLNCPRPSIHPSNVELKTLTVFSLATWCNWRRCS